MSTSIGMTKLTRLINKAMETFDCDKCLWSADCGKIHCGCQVSMTILSLVKGGYLDVKESKQRKRTKKGSEE